MPIKLELVIIKFIPIAANNPQPAGFKAYIAALRFLLLLNLFNNFVSVMTIMYDGKTIAKVASIEPNMPAVV